MVATQLTLYNGALMLCGARRIANLTVNEEARYLLDDVWNRGAIDNCLEAGLWNHALRTAMFDADTGYTDPFSGGWYRFQKPSDWVRVAGVWTDPSFTQPDLSYRDEGNYLYSNYPTLYISFVSNGASYGGDYSLWPKSFERYVEGWLALQIIGRLTGGTTDKQLVEQRVRKLMASALAKDAQRDPTKFPPENGWNAVRRGFSGNRGNRDYSGM